MNRTVCVIRAQIDAVKQAIYIGLLFSYSLFFVSLWIEIHLIMQYLYLCQDGEGPRSPKSSLCSVVQLVKLHELGLHIVDIKLLPWTLTLRIVYMDQELDSFDN